MFNKKNLFYLLISFLLVLSMSINITNFSITETFIKNDGLNVFYILIFIALYKFLEKRDKKVNISILIFAMIISITNIFAIYLKNEYTDNATITLIQYLKTIICFSGWSLLYYFLIDYLFEFLNRIKFKKIKNNFLNFVFDKHPIISIIIILTISYLPILIIGYPGIYTADGLDELKQYNHIFTWSLKYINLIDPKIYINGHHSPFHTYILGFIFNLFDSPKIGTFVYIIIQTILQIAVFAYMFNLFKKLNVNYYLRLIVLIVIISIPFYNFSIIGIYKDVTFSLFITMYTMLLIEYFYLHENSKNKLAFLLIISLIIMLLTNKGIYLVFLTTIMIFFKIQKNKKIFTLFLIPIIIYFGITKILFPFLHITPGSIQETLALPIQQVSRCIVYYEDDLTDYDKKVISDLLPYDSIKTKYNPIIVDPIKNKFNKNYTSKQIKDFIIVWGKLFFKHPVSYIKAFANLTIGYVDFGAHNDLAYFTNINTLNKANSFEKKLLPIHEHQLIIIRNIYLGSRNIPLFGTLLNLALYFWLLLSLMLYLITNKKKEYLLPFIPSFGVLLFLFVSPVSGNKRYVLPIIYNIPILLAYTSSIKYIIIKNRKVL